MAMQESLDVMEQMAVMENQDFQEEWAPGAQLAWLELMGFLVILERVASTLLGSKEKEE